MGFSKNLHKHLAAFGIAALCFGYFASYIPFSMLTKMLTRGMLPGMNGVGVSGFEIQPVAALGTCIGMYLFITLSKWWKFATHSKILGVSVPRPQWFTFISGICTSGIIVTTVLAYTFQGISIVFAMLLMRGGVLIMAPVIDMIVKRRKRKIYWPSWIASALSFGALIIAFSGKAGTAITFIAGADICLYLFSYFFRLYFMSNRAKGDSTDERKRYFVEEQMVANPAMLILLFIIGWFGSASDPAGVAGGFWQGFVSFPFKGYFLITLLIGLLSYSVGLFGTLIFLDKRENTFTVPANRSSSIMAGVVATYLLYMFFGGKAPATDELVGAGMIIVAIVFLAYRSTMDKRKAALKMANKSKPGL